MGKIPYYEHWMRKDVITFALQHSACMIPLYLNLFLECPGIRVEYGDNEEIKIHVMWKEKPHDPFRFDNPVKRIHK